MPKEMNKMQDNTNFAKSGNNEGKANKKRRYKGYKNKAKKHGAQNFKSPKQNADKTNDIIATKPQSEQKNTSAPQTKKTQVNMQSAKIAASEKDNSIKLITRKAPLQKYANFDEYMKSRTDPDNF